MHRKWRRGDPAPDFKARSTSSKEYHFNTSAGRYTVLFFFGSAMEEKARAVLAHLVGKKRIFNDNFAIFFGVSTDPEDEKHERVKQFIPGYRYFWDTDQKVSKLYGALPDADGPQTDYQPFTLLLDPMMRVLAAIPLEDAATHNDALDKSLAALPPIDDHAGVPLNAPVLIVPRVFDPAFCKHLIEQYHTHGGRASGFMRQVGGKTVGILDSKFKRRKDFEFNNQPEFEELRKGARARIVRHLIPEIEKAFQYKATRMERYIVSCYEGEEGGFFRPHRDNTTAATAHRKFACSLNLNTEEYEGGDLRFPEFGTRTYRAPTGGAVVFSCSLLHEATPVTKGTRYAFLPFFYDEEAAKIREQNQQFLAKGMVDKNKGESEYTMSEDNA